MARYTSNPIATSNDLLFLKIRYDVKSQTVTSTTPKVGKSTVIVKVLAYKTAAASINTTGTGNLKIVVDGAETNVSWNTAKTIKANSESDPTTIWEQTYTINHNGDGTKRLVTTLKSFHLNVSNPSCNLKNVSSFDHKLPTLQIYDPDTGLNAPSGVIAQSKDNTMTCTFTQASNDVVHNVKLEIGNVSAWWTNVDSMSSDKVVSITRNGTTASKYLLIKLVRTNFKDGNNNTHNFLNQFTTTMTRDMKITLSAYANKDDALAKKNAISSLSKTVSVSIGKTDFLPLHEGQTIVSTRLFTNTWSIQSSSGNPSYSAPSPSVLTGTSNSTPVIATQTELVTSVTGKPYTSGSISDGSPISSMTLKYGSKSLISKTNTSTSLNLSITSYSFKPDTSSTINAVITNRRGQTKTYSMFTTSKFYPYTQCKVVVDAVKTTSSGIELTITGKWSPAFWTDNTPINKLYALLYYKKPGDSTWELYPGETNNNMFNANTSSTTGSATIKRTIDPTDGGSTPIYGNYSFRVIYHDSFTSGYSIRSFTLNNQDETQFETDADTEAHDISTPRYLNMLGRRLGIGGRAGFDSTAKQNSITVRWDTYIRKPVHLLAGAVSSGTGSALVLDTNSVIKVQSSAKKYKKNINYNLDINKYHDEFTNIKPAEYEYKTQDGKQLGFIADDINEINSDFIIKNANGEVENYKDRDMIALLCLEVKRQNAIIDKLLEETGISIDDLFPESNVIDVEPLDE